MNTPQISVNYACKFTNPWTNKEEKLDYLPLKGAIIEVGDDEDMPAHVGVTKVSKPEKDSDGLSVLKVTKMSPTRQPWAKDSAFGTSFDWRNTALEVLTAKFIQAAKEILHQTSDEEMDADAWNDEEACIWWALESKVIEDKIAPRIKANLDREELETFLDL